MGVEETRDAGVCAAGKEGEEGGKGLGAGGGKAREVDRVQGMLCKEIGGEFEIDVGEGGTKRTKWVCGAAERVLALGHANGSRTIALRCTSLCYPSTECARDGALEARPPVALGPLVIAVEEL